MTVIDLDSRRGSSATTGSDMALCQCGSGWFVLRGRATDPEIADNGAVAMSASGAITGYIGEPVCAECGEPWVPFGVAVRGLTYTTSRIDFDDAAVRGSAVPSGCGDAGETAGHRSEQRGWVDG